MARFWYSIMKNIAKCTFNPLLNTNTSSSLLYWTICTIHKESFLIAKAYGMPWPWSGVASPSQLLGPPTPPHTPKIKKERLIQEEKKCKQTSGLHSTWKNMNHK